MGQLPDFDNTELAFAYKGDLALMRDYSIFKMMSFNTLVNTGIFIADKLVKSGIVFPVELGIRPTVYSLFCGGTSLARSEKKIAQLYRYGIDSILDYGVEGKESEEDFEKTATAIRQAIHFAADHPGVRIVCSKFTSLIPFHILEKLHNGSALTDEEQQWLDTCQQRIEDIAALAAQKGIILFIDAEESWIQRPLDELTLELMRKYNREKPVIYNTIQLYLRDRLDNFRSFVRQAQEEGFIYAAKLVRGAYMEKEEAYAGKHGLPNPVQHSKADTDRAYDEAVAFAIENLEKVAVCVATHNEASSMRAVQLAMQKHIPANHPHLNFAQLLGMSDHISFNLAKAGYNVSKYMPYGPVREVIPYLIRRAQENSSVSGQMGRELQLHTREMKRRNLIPDL